MNRQTTLFALILIPFLLAGTWTQQHDITVRNITVPVRVFDNGNFVDTLSLEDFEIIENGTVQKPEALYLVRKGNIERKEENVGFFPLWGASFLCCSN